MSSAHGAPRPTNSAGRKRVAILTAALLVAAVDLAAKAVAVSELQTPVALGVLELRLSYNPGVAFSMGDALPPIVVVVFTTVIALAVATYVVVAGPDLSRWLVIGLVLVAGGALGNVVDRARNGAVTDFFYTGWFATFNLADVFITFGAVALLWGTLQGARDVPPR